MLNGFEDQDLTEAVSRARTDLEALRRASLFVTGGTGFFGQWLLAVIAHANATLDLQIDVTVLTRSVALFEKRCPDFRRVRCIKLVEGDVRYFEFPKGRFTHIVHAAAETSAAADKRPLRMIDTIVGGTRRVLDFASSSQVDRVLIISSGAVYGEQPSDVALLSESFTGACAPSESRSAYGQAKRMAEQLGTIYFSENGLGVIAARAFAFVGPGLPLDGHFAIGNFIRDAVNGKTLVIKGDGSQVRSYLYAADLVVWLLRLLVSARPGSTYNVGSDQAISLAELAKVVTATIPGAQGFEIRGEFQPNGLRSRYVPAIDRARNELGLEAWTSLSAAILRTARWAERTIETASPHDPEHDSASSMGHAHEYKRPLTFVVDVDGVVATLTPGNEYGEAAPISSTIAKINRLYDAGHRIVMFTARGSTTGIDWAERTRDQLDEWGLKYHELRFGKPAGDFYVDDRLLSISDLMHILGDAE